MLAFKHKVSDPFRPKVLLIFIQLPAEPKPPRALEIANVDEIVLRFLNYLQNLQNCDALYKNWPASVNAPLDDSLDIDMTVHKPTLSQEEV